MVPRMELGKVEGRLMRLGGGFRSSKNKYSITQRLETIAAFLDLRRAHISANPSPPHTPTSMAPSTSSSANFLAKSSPPASVDSTLKTRDLKKVTMKTWMRFSRKSGDGLETGCIFYF